MEPKPHESCKWDRRKKVWVCGEAARDVLAGRGKKRGTASLGGLSAGAAQPRIEVRDPSRLVLEEKPMGAKNAFQYEAKIDGVTVGRLLATKARTKVKGRVVYAITEVYVTKGARRQGVATALYEVAAKEACRRRSRIASVQRRTGAFSNEFWEKQAAKGRAEVHKMRAYADPVFVLRDCPPPRSLRGLRRRR